eukprot:scaffold947_cov375-Prasinococcus_capsulatus_cf.AAC.3
MSSATLQTIEKAMPDTLPQPGRAPPPYRRARSTRDGSYRKLPPVPIRPAKPAPQETFATPDLEERKAQRQARRARNTNGRRSSRQHRTSRSQRPSLAEDCTSATKLTDAEEGQSKWTTIQSLHSSRNDVKPNAVALPKQANTEAQRRAPSRCEHG